MRYLTIVLAALLLAFSAYADPASADGVYDDEPIVIHKQPRECSTTVCPSDVGGRGLYMGIEAGFSDFVDNRINADVLNVARFSAKSDAEDGYNVGAFIGYRLDPMWRIDANLGYRSWDSGVDDPEADVDLSGLPLGTYTNGSDDWDDRKGGFSTEGLGALFGDNEDATLRIASVMGNVTHDATYLTLWGFVPYASAGIGVAFLDLDSRGGLLSVKDESYELAYQFGAGISRPLWRRMHVSAGYRYFATTSPNFDGDLAALVDTRVTGLDVSAHEAVVGVRWEF